MLQSRSRKFSSVCASITVVIPLPFQCGSDPIPIPLGPAFASLSYLIFVIATVQLVSPLSASVTSEQAGNLSLSQLPANKLATPLSVSITSKQAGRLLSLSQSPANKLDDSSLCLSHQQTSWTTPLCVSVTSEQAGNLSLSQLPANKLATPLSVSVTSEQAGNCSLCLSYQQTSWPLLSVSQLPASRLSNHKAKQSLCDCMFTLVCCLS